MYSEKRVAGAGSQFDSLSFPGDFAPAYSVSEPSVFVCSVLFLVPSEKRLSGFGLKKWYWLYRVSDQKPLTGGS
jgi:hypothetical protein